MNRKGVDLAVGSAGRCSLTGLDLVQFRLCLLGGFGCPWGDLGAVVGPSAFIIAGCGCCAWCLRASGLLAVRVVVLCGCGLVRGLRQDWAWLWLHGSLH